MALPEYWNGKVVLVIRNQVRPGFILESDLAPPQFGWDNLITSKALLPFDSARSIRLFFQQEVVAGGTQGASRIALWLLNDDCNNQTIPCPQHQFSQAYDSNPGTNRFLRWFNAWWYTPE